ncbi:M48 family metalloprotease [Embleya sp. NPDC059237]|uniref:M48 family metalloprotease n=1 Tax=Embleya sp. NPDC059237 TaxID=3346784 RepID=UPI003681AE96
MTLPTALLSLLGVVALFALISPFLGLVTTVAWLLSGTLVFHRPTEAAIARYVLGMRRPCPTDARRLDGIWGEVTRRAGVRQETYELWIEDAAELNASAAAGHIVGVTRHAVDRLPDSQLAAILAHELGHHVGGHTWAGMLANWYSLPARTVGRWIVTGATTLMASSNRRGIFWAIGLSLVFLYTLAFRMGMWWLMLPVAIGPLLLSGLHRRAEFRADDYAGGLGFGAELVTVLAREQRERVTPGMARMSVGTERGSRPRVPQVIAAATRPGPTYAGGQKVLRGAVRGFHPNHAVRIERLRRAGYSGGDRGGG